MIIAGRGIPNRRLRQGDTEHPWTWFVGETRWVVVIFEVIEQMDSPAIIPIATVFLVTRF